MPLSEFLRMARGKLESSQQKTDVSSRSENDLVELVWENGQIVMQGQSGRVTQSPTRNPNTSRVRDSKVGHATTSRFGKFGGAESILNDMAPVVPSGELDLSHDDEMAPWFNYPIDDTIGQGYVSEFIPGISGVTGNGMSNRSSFLSVDKRNGCGGTTLKTTSSSKGHPLCSLPRQHCQGLEALGSGVSDIVSNDQDAAFGRQNIRPPSTSGSNFLNFSHISRPANRVKPKDIELRGSSAALPKVNSQDPVVNTPKGGVPPERTKNLCLEASIKNDKAAMLSKTGNSRKGVPDGERIVEPMVASSSVGSGNSADRVSCEQTHNSKRKFRDIDESDCRSDDVDTESLDAKKPSHLQGSKRGRAAEVHNLSERRRRDRINEKMRALQELIPNCNKADKASMLDEAIEYLKTLQLQVQFMSIGTGLCMPQMMFPTGMQHIHPAHVPHFPPMGVGMGMGMGFGMGMMDMNGVTSGYPMFPVPPMLVPHFRPPVSGSPNFQRIPIPMFGHPGQGLQNSVPRAPFVPLTSAMGMNASRNGNSSEVANTSSIVNPMNSQSICNAEASCSMDKNSNQATTEVLAQSASLQDNKQGANAMGPTALSSTATTTGISKEPA